MKLTFPITKIIKKRVPKSLKILIWGVLGRHLGPLGELLGPSAPKSVSRAGKIGRRVAPRVPNWDPILDMLAPSSRKELSERCFFGGPLRDHFLSDFLVLFQGGPDTEN